MKLEFILVQFEGLERVAAWFAALILVHFGPVRTAAFVHADVGVSKLTREFQGLIDGIVVNGLETIRDHVQGFNFLTCIVSSLSHDFLSSLFTDDSLYFKF